MLEKAYVHEDRSCCSQGVNGFLEETWLVPRLYADDALLRQPTDYSCNDAIDIKVRESAFHDRRKNTCTWHP